MRRRLAARWRRRQATIFGSAGAFGSGTAVITTNVVYDQFGSHTPALWAYVAMFIVSALMVLRLGSYPQLPPVATTRSP